MPRTAELSKGIKPKPRDTYQYSYPVLRIGLLMEKDVDYT
jgi:hypothetical protein